MSQNSLFRTSTFRLSLTYMALFATSVLVLLGFLYWNTTGFIDQQTDNTINAEISGLDEQFRRTGLVGLIHIVRERSRRQRLGLYQLRSPDGRNLGGNLDVWPAEQPDENGWINFTFDTLLGRSVELRHARARLIVLHANYQLLVGHDNQARYELEQRLQASLIWAVILTLVFGVTGGLLLSRGWLNRINAINQTSAEIMAGDLDRRIALAGKNDELDMLATKLNSMLDRIQELMQSLHQVTDNIAHDLRSPLNRMRSHFELLLLDDRANADYRDALEQGVVEIDELLQIFDALLSIAEAETSGKASDMQATDLAELTEDVVDLYLPAMEEQGITLKQQLEPDTVVHVNPRLISQAIANLLENALKYAAKPGILNVKIRSDKTGVEAIVEDNGPGIPEHERQNVLKRFYRLDGTRQSAGNGLGLSLVAVVAQIHGAEFSLSDAKPGLRAIIRFPILPVSN